MTTQFDDKGKIFTNVISKIPVPVTIQTITHRIHGEIYVRPSERVKDELNRSEDFLAVTDAIIFDNDGKVMHRCSFLTINQTHIVWLLPDDEVVTE